MKVAILADVHDNAHNLVMTLDSVYKTEAEKIIFLGDFVGAAIAELMSSSKLPVYAIWGNNDGDRALITKISHREESRMEIGMDTFDIHEVDGKRLFLTHYPTLAESMAKSGDFDAVFYGHNHTKRKDKIKNCLIVNPGEVGAYKTGQASYAIYDTKENDAEIIDVEGSITTNTKEAKKKFEEIQFEFNKRESHKL